MSMEAGVVVGIDGDAIYWHLPPDRSGGALPDSRALWDFIWENRDRILGIAHSHPGNGIPGPSYTDVTTFAAIEDGIGRRLGWWITSEDRLVVVRWLGPDKLSYVCTLVNSRPEWLQHLRDVSYMNRQNVVG